MKPISTAALDRALALNNAHAAALSLQTPDSSRRVVASGRGFIGCEVKLDLPNPASDRLHARLGFEPLGTADLPGKRVRYFGRRS